MPQDHSKTTTQDQNNFYDAGAPHQQVQRNGTTASKPKPKRPKGKTTAASNRSTLASGHQRSPSRGQASTTSRPATSPPKQTIKGRSNRRSLPPAPADGDANRGIAYDSTPDDLANSNYAQPTQNHGNGGENPAPTYATPNNDAGRRQLARAAHPMSTASGGAGLYDNKEGLQGGNPEPAQYNVLAPRTGTETANDNTAVASTQNHTELTAVTTSNGLPQNSVIYMAANPGQLAEGNAAALYTVTNATQEGHIPATRDERNNLVFVRAPTGPDYAEPNVNQQDGTVTRANQLYSGQGSFSVNDGQGSLHAAPNFNGSGAGQVAHGTSFLDDAPESTETGNPAQDDDDTATSCWPCSGGGSNAADANTQPPHAYANPAYEGNQLQNNPRLAVNGIYGERNPTASDGFQREVEGLAGQTADSYEDAGEPVIYENAGDAGDAAGNAGITTAKIVIWISVVLLVILTATLLGVGAASDWTYKFGDDDDDSSDNLDCSDVNQTVNTAVATINQLNITMGDALSAVAQTVTTFTAADAALVASQQGNKTVIADCLKDEHRLRIQTAFYTVADDGKANDDVDNDDTTASTTPEAESKTDPTKATTPAAESKTHPTKATAAAAESKTDPTKATTPEAESKTDPTKTTTSVTEPDPGQTAGTKPATPKAPVTEPSSEAAGTDSSAPVTEPSSEAAGTDPATSKPVVVPPAVQCCGIFVPRGKGCGSVRTPEYCDSDRACGKGPCR